MDENVELDIPQKKEEVNTVQNEGLDSGTANNENSEKGTSLELEKSDKIRREFLYHGTDQEVNGHLRHGSLSRNIGGVAFYLSPDPAYALDYSFMMTGREGHAKYYEAKPNMLRMELLPGTKILNLNDLPSEELVSKLFHYAYEKNMKLFEGKKIEDEIEFEMGWLEESPKKYRLDDLIAKLGIDYTKDREFFTNLDYSGIRITRRHIGSNLLSEVAVWDTSILENAVSAPPILPFKSNEGITQEAEDLLKAIDQERGDPTGSLWRICEESGVEIPEDILKILKKNQLQASEKDKLVSLLRVKSENAKDSLTSSRL